MTLSATRTRLALVIACVLAVAIGCGSSPTDSGTGASGTSSPASGLDAVYDAVDGLSGTERFDKLIQLAKQEGGSVSFYHSGDMTTENKAFTAKTGVKVADFQATSERVAERVLQEQKAGRVGSDVVLGGATDLVALQKAGGLGKLDSPAFDAVTDDFRSTDLVSAMAIMDIPTYNTTTVKKSDLPDSWLDFFTSFTKRKAIELTDWQWFYTIVTKYFEAQKGMSEKDAIDLIRKGMKGAAVVDGHTLVAQLLASGQYDYVPNLYAQYIPRLVGKGAPLSYEGVSTDLPPSVHALSMGLTADSKHPAAGLLYLEWMMSADGQKAVADAGYVPPANTYQGPPTLLQQFSYALVNDTSKLSNAEQKKWKDAFDELLRDAGTKKVDGK